MDITRKKTGKSSVFHISKMMKYTCIKNLASATNWVGNTFCELSIGVPEAETLDLSLLRGVFLDITRKTWEIDDFLWFSKTMKYTCIKNLASATKWVGNTFCELSIRRIEAET